MVGIFNSCKKITSNTDNIVYEENIKGIKKLETVALTFVNNSSSAKVIWTVTPNNKVHISSVGNSANIIFENAGTYTVLANASGIYAKYYITVVDSIYNDYGNKFNVIAPKFYSIKHGEPLVFTAVNKHAGAIVSWTVFGGNSYTIVADSINNTATITFTGVGFGEVTATDGFSTIRRTVWINNDANPNANQDTVSFIVGDKLQLKPSIDTINGIKYLSIKATTTKNYHCSTDAILSYSVNGNYTIDYAAVAISPQPCNATSVASCSNSFSNIAVGTHIFTINFENKTFTGTLTVDSAGVYTFNWQDASVINILPF